MIADTGDVTKVSVRAITKRAGVSPTALYLHFPDRDAIVDAAIDAGFAAFNARSSTRATAEAEPRPRLRAMGEAYLAFAQRRPELYSVIFTARRPPSGERRRSTATPPSTRSSRRSPTAARPTRTGRRVALWSALHGYAMLGACGPIAKTFEPPEAFVARIGPALVA